MDGPKEPGPQGVSWARAASALLVFVALAVLTTGYHDGAFGTEELGSSSALDEGSYRFKGTVERWEAEEEWFELRDETGSRQFLWNITTPKVGEVYVVDAERAQDGDLVALALTRPLFIEGHW